MATCAYIMQNLKWQKVLACYLGISTVPNQYNGYELESLERYFEHLLSTHNNARGGNLIKCCCGFEHCAVLISSTKM